MVVTGASPVLIVQHNIISPLVTSHTAIASGRCIMTPNTMSRPKSGRAPSCIVGAWTRFCMARLARILFVANHATGAIPRGDGTMRTQSPYVVMRPGLHNAVALLTGIFRMADAACGIVLHAEQAMALGPGHIMTGRFLITIHINVARQAILSRSMRLIANHHNIGTL